MDWHKRQVPGIEKAVWAGTYHYLPACIGVKKFAFVIEKANAVKLHCSQQTPIPYRSDRIQYLYFLSLIPVSSNRVQPWFYPAFV